MEGRMKQEAAICTGCPYYGRGFVPGYGDSEASIMMIGEAPGRDESFRSHRPFTGPAGDELDRYLKAIHLNRDDIYITNLVKCNPPDNEDPIPEVIERCNYYLSRELVEVGASTIVTLGGVALHVFSPGMSLEMVWGVPQELKKVSKWVITLFPLYHLALGLHQSRMLPMIEGGFKRFGLWLSGNEVWSKDSVAVNYKKTNATALRGEWWGAAAVGVDTETTWDGVPLYLQMSMKEGEAILLENPGVVTRSAIEEGDGVIVLHNSMFDLEVLHQIGIHPRKVVDTMVMAYLLGDMPQGLKPLAYRLCGMEMRSYQDVISTHGQDKAREYLEVASCLDWPSPEHILEFKKDGSPHVKKPQNIGRKIGAALTASEKGEVDLRERWKKMDGTEVVEERLGPMPGADLRDVPEGEAIHYACRDADATRRIYPVLLKRIKDEGLEEVLRMDMGIIPMALEMQRNGITVDPGALQVAGASFQSKMEDEQRWIQSIIGYDINPGSSQQVAEMLDRIGIVPKSKRGKSGAQSTGVKILEPLRKVHPVIPHILEWRKFETLLTMFVNPIPKLIGEDGRLHPTIKVTRTVTGRLAMEDPNLQNIPVRTEEGRMIRDCFVAQRGWVLLSSDYSQIELRVLAHMSQDEAMIKAFLEGYDLHTATAAEMFNVPMGEVDDYRHRRPAKTVNFGIPYGITAMGLVDTMAKEGAGDWSEATCQDLIDRWFRARPGVKAFMDECHAHARRFGFIKDMFGRRRLLPEVHSSNKHIVEEALRFAGNQPIQSGAQGIIKLAMAKLWTDTIMIIHEEYPDRIRPLLQLHDDLLLEVREEDVECMAMMVKEVMENVVGLSIPTPVDQKVGERWGSMKKVNGY